MFRVGAYLCRLRAGPGLPLQTAAATATATGEALGPSGTFSDTIRRCKSDKGKCDKSKPKGGGGGGASGGVCNVQIHHPGGPMKAKLLKPVSDPKPFSGSKVTVVGAGNVGMACAMAMLTQYVTSEMAVLDANAEKCRGEVLDLQQGSLFLRNASISGGSDPKCTANSRVIVITAGARQAVGESRLDLVKRNVSIFKKMIPPLVKASPNAIILVVSNPVDIMTYVTWKLTKWPKNRVMGSGCALDSARLRTFVADKLGLAPASVHAWMIGEHGDSSVPVWSGVNVAGVRLRFLNPKMGREGDPEKWDEVHKQVVASAYEVIKLKGYTSSAIGLAVSRIVRHILRNEQAIVPVSTYVKGHQGIEEEVFLSLPCVVGENGITAVVDQPLTEDETAKLCKSSCVISEVQKGLDL